MGGQSCQQVVALGRQSRSVCRQVSGRQLVWRWLRRHGRHDVWRARPCVWTRFLLREQPNRPRMVRRVPCWRLCRHLWWKGWQCQSHYMYDKNSHQHNHRQVVSQANSQRSHRCVGSCSSCSTDKGGAGWRRGPCPHIYTAFSSYAPCAFLLLEFRRRVGQCFFAHLFYACSRPCQAVASFFDAILRRAYWGSCLLARAFPSMFHSVF